MKNDYPNGIPEILEMIENQRFDKDLAEKLLSGVDLNAPIITQNIGSFEISGTYLFEAVVNNNLPAVEFLLEHGADPNYFNEKIDDDCALWELQYIDSNQDWETRYEICKLFFKYGADPNIKNDGETLYEYILFKIYYDTANNDVDFENLTHLYMLLCLYGGGDDSVGRPKLYNANLDKINEFDISFSMDKNGVLISGTVIDKEGNVIAEV
ncbi:MAG: hypothetical protein IJS45_03985 [Clostridia bacterium]|nr:hypothetical protein [Clostridia bacterium]